MSIETLLMRWKERLDKYKENYGFREDVLSERWGWVYFELDLCMKELASVDEYRNRDHLYMETEEVPFEVTTF